MVQKFWDGTFKSQLLGCIEITREEARAEDLRERLEAEWPTFREAFLERARTWKDEVEYDRIEVPLDGLVTMREKR